MIESLFAILIAALLIWLIFFVLGQIPMPHVLRVVITAVIGIAILWWLLRHLGVVHG